MVTVEDDVDVALRRHCSQEQRESARYEAGRGTMVYLKSQQVTPSSFPLFTTVLTLVHFLEDVGVRWACSLLQGAETAACSRCSIHSFTSSIPQLADLVEAREGKHTFDNKPLPDRTCRRERGNDAAV